MIIHTFILMQIKFICFLQFFSWVQNKLDGRRGSQKPQANKEEDNLDSLSHGVLLSIGTLGNQDHTSRDDPKIIRDQRDMSPSSCPDLSEFTQEEVGQLQKELTKLLKRKPSDHVIIPNPDILPLDRFLNCPSSLEISRRMPVTAACSELAELRKDGIEHTISVIIGKCKEVRAEREKKKNKEAAIGKKSFSFLLNKFCAFSTTAFSPAPSFRDPLLESRMEKLLRAIVDKKLYQQNASHTSTTKRYIIENKQRPNNADEESEKPPVSSNGSKWDKSDAEYIVLEI
ncbi:hypothetical protein Dimus_003986 [Dionaea muscipula]